MKLIVCDCCRDVVGLSPEERICRCGASRGHYTDDHHIVEVEGPCRVIGFPNRLLYGTIDQAEAWVFHEPHDRIIRKGNIPIDQQQEALIEVRA